MDIKHCIEDHWFQDLWDICARGVLFPKKNFEILVHIIQKKFKFKKYSICDQFSQSSGGLGIAYLAI